MATNNAVTNGRVMPRQQVPELSVPTLDADTWTLSEQNPENFTAIFFYRGYHCPQCKLQVRDIDRNIDKFTELGVNVIVISSNTEEFAQKTKEEWGVENVTIGYDLSLETARKWGLFLSDSIKPTEPERFSEPGIFFVRPDGTLYASIISTMPFARPDTKTIVAALKTVIEKEYPARGEVSIFS
ncbi:MAG: hypothetical protein Phog2KO_42650 [Phototrophicaceae bacterium]